MPINIKVRAIVDCSFPMVQWEIKRRGNTSNNKLYDGPALYAVKLLNELIRDDSIVNVSLDKVIFTGKGSDIKVDDASVLAGLAKNYPSYSGINLRSLEGTGASSRSDDIINKIEDIYDTVAESSSNDYYVFVVFACRSIECDNEKLKKIISHIQDGDIPLLSVYYIKTESTRNGKEEDLFDQNVVKSGLARIQDASRRISQDANITRQTYRQCVRILSLRNAQMDRLGSDIIYLKKLIKDAYANSSRRR